MLERMNKQQFDGLVDSLVNSYSFNTTNDYSLSLRRREYLDRFYGTIIVFPNTPGGYFTYIEAEQLLELGRQWNAVLYFQTLHGVTVAKFL